MLSRRSHLQDLEPRSTAELAAEWRRERLSPLPLWGTLRALLALGRRTGRSQVHTGDPIRPVGDVCSRHARAQLPTGLDSNQQTSG